MTDNGKRALRISSAAGEGKDEERMFLEDGDKIVLRGWCGGGDGSDGDDDGGMEALVGFGECVGTIEPAVELAL